MSSIPVLNALETLNITNEKAIILSESFNNIGIRFLYDWQSECLRNTGICTGMNLVYTAPTGGGKTMVAELLILKTVIVLRMKAILVVPFVSLVIEKATYFEKLVKHYN